MAATTQLTIEQFEALPDEITERHELVKGELVEVSSPIPQNASTRDYLIAVLVFYFAEHDSGEAFSELDVCTSEDTVRRPDISIFSREQMHRVDRYKVPVPESPIIAVEVLSPSESFTEVTHKVLEYLRAGSREVWLLDHLNREIRVRTAAGETLLTAGNALESKLLPGFSISVDQIFSRGRRKSG